MPPGWVGIRFFEVKTVFFIIFVTGTDALSMRRASIILLPAVALCLLSCHRSAACEKACHPHCSIIGKHFADSLLQRIQ